MNPQHKMAIANNRVLFHGELHFDVEFLGYFNGGVPIILNDNICETIMSKVTRQAQIADFLTMIQRRGVYAFDRLIKALVYTDQNHLAEALDPNLTTHYDNIRLTSGSVSEQPVNNNPIDSTGQGEKSTVKTNPKDSAGQVKKSTSNVEESFMTFDSIGEVSEEEVYSLVNDSKTPAYDLHRKPRGRCIILDNDSFSSPHSKREGSEFDAINTDQLFQTLHFESDKWSNLTAAAIKEHIEREKKCSDHAMADAFIFVAMSHGNQGKIYGTDRKPISIQKDIMDQFDGNNCPHLHGKPKIFIIQACQGKDSTDGELENSPEDEQLSKTMEKMSLVDENDSPKIQFNVQKKADFFSVYATVPGYKALRENDSGSWFIQDFLHAVVKLCRYGDIQDIMKEVTKRVEERAGPNGQKQICKVESTLTKSLHFFPGYPK